MHNRHLLCQNPFSCHKTIFFSHNLIFNSFFFPRIFLIVFLVVGFVILYCSQEVTALSFLIENWIELNRETDNQRQKGLSYQQHYIMLTSIISSWLIFFAFRQICASFGQGRKCLSTITATGIRFSLFHISYETPIFNNFFFSYFNTQDPWKRRYYTIYIYIWSHHAIHHNSS